VGYTFGCLYRSLQEAQPLRTLPLHRESVIPLYYQIQQQLLAQIKTGELKAGDSLLSEQEISSQLRVSRMTARQAFKSLCKLGVAYSLQGKGTFVSGIKLEKNFRQAQSFTEEMEALGYRPGSKVLALEIIPAQGEVSKALHLKSGDEVVKLRRVRLADSVPMGIETSHLPYHLCPGLVKAFDPHTSLYQGLWSSYGLRIQFADEIVEAGLAAPEEARLLQITSRSPVFLFTRVSYVREGQVVEYVKATYRADRYKIVNRLTRLEL